MTLRDWETLIQEAHFFSSRLCLMAENTLFSFLILFSLLEGEDVAAISQGG